MTTPVKVWLMQKEIGYVSRDLANKLYRNLTATLVKTKRPVLDSEGNPVILEGIRDSWVMDVNGKMKNVPVPTLRRVMLERTEGIRLSPFVVGSISKRRSQFLEERASEPLPFEDIYADVLPTVQYTLPIVPPKGDMDLDTTGTRIGDIAESILVASEKYKTELAFALAQEGKYVPERNVVENDDLIVRGTYIPPKGEVSIHLTGMDLDEFYASLSPRDQQFLHDTILSNTTSWGDNRTEEEKEIARQKEERYNADVRALKEKWGSGFYHGE